METWPTEKAVRRGAGALDEGGDSQERVWSQSEREDKARAVLEAAGLPELMGRTQASAELGVDSANLHKIAGLPEPLYRLPAGSFFEADGIRALKRQRARRATAKAAS